MLGFKGGWPEIAVSRDRRNVQSTNTRPPSKIADTFYFTSRAPLRMVCWLRVFLPETLVSAPRAPSTRFTLEKKDQAVEDGSSWKYRSVDWKRFSHGKFRRGLDCISRNNRHQSRHEFLFLRNQIWRTIRWQIRLRDRMMRSFFKGWEIWKRKWEKIEINNYIFFLERN